MAKRPILDAEKIIKAIESFAKSGPPCPECGCNFYPAHYGTCPSLFRPLPR